MNDERPEPIGADQVNALGADLDRLIDRYVDEFDLPVASVVGVLTMKASALTLSAIEEDDEDFPT